MKKTRPENKTKQSTEIAITAIFVDQCTIKIEILLKETPRKTGV